MARQPRPRWGQRLQQWWLARQPATAQHTLSHRNTYILPTRAGWMLALTLLAMLVGSINYQLNLGYLLTFLLAGSAVAALHITHANLRGLVLHIMPPAPGFAGAALDIELIVHNPHARPRPALSCRLLSHTQDAWLDAPAQGQASVHLRWPPPHRGHLPLPAIRVETRFPLGLFRAWTLWRPATLAWVYPRPEQSVPPLPAAATVTSPSAPQTAASHAAASEPEGVRPYRRGDAPKHILWKRAAQAIARGSGELLSRDHAPSAAPQPLWLDLRQTGLSEPEAQLSRLCAWVLAADRLGAAYGLCLPGQTIAPDSGPIHRQRCLEALALCTPR